MVGSRGREFREPHAFHKRGESRGRHALTHASVRPLHRSSGHSRWDLARAHGTLTSLPVRHHPKLPGSVTAIPTLVPAM